ncbi:MarR family winged helix-turn-helix transcriptional regulator [Orrella marina]|uniref:MarR family transcriptional regulator n=1 Tax=Orrella marina TaxID=2163011 RepID=A0A2R4XN27_9BURK|nr:MarR family transcriptional regulator [Orrella marina]AWB35216.1 MarR family transcriptional regulator [Orrella marina]
MAGQDIQDAVCVDFERLSQFRYRLRCFLRVSEDICREHGLTPLQYQLMLHLKGQPDRDWATISELAERLQSRHHGVVALVNRCEAAGLVRRGPCPTDQRQVRVYLCADAEAVLEQVATLHQPELTRLREVLAMTGLSA